MTVSQDLLGHPNTRAFLSHAGYLGLEEALCHGIPVLATPICYDQFDNAAEVERLGVGRAIKFTELTQENLSSALDQVQ